MTSLSLHLARIIITNDGKPIINGGLLIDSTKIIQAGKKEDFGSIPKSNIEVIDHGESIICPGFINLHCHLIYSNVTSLARSSGLFSWLEGLVNCTSHWTEKDYVGSINNGIQHALSTGTTFIVENTPKAYLSACELAKSSLRALIGLEVFGSDEQEANKTFSAFSSQLSALSFSPKLDYTFSPHAPYDVSRTLWKKLLQWVEENDKPLLTHLEESLQEKQWWQKKSGEAVNFWKKINKLESKLKYWKKYKSSIDFLNTNKLLSKQIIATHLCGAELEDLKILNSYNIKLVHCPRSNFYLNNPTSNLKLWHELGFLWGIGTDSLASNADLDLLEELRFAIKQQDLIYSLKIPAKDAFCAITSCAGKIIKKELGALKPTYYADFLVYDIQGKSACTYNDPYHLIVCEINNKKDLKEVWINGEKVWISQDIFTRIKSCYA